MEQAFQEYVQRFEEGTVDGLLLAEIVEVFGPRRTHMKAMYERYKMNGKYIPGMTKELPVKTVFDERVVGDYVGQAVDIKVGYFAGIPIAYSYDKDMPESQDATDKIYRFNRLNRIADLDSETAKWSAITGYGVRLLYMDDQKRERVMNVPSYDCIFIGELTEPTGAIRLYQDGEDMKADVYTPDSITTFLELDGEYQAIEEELNVFKVVPLIGYPNNSELQGDCDKAITTIDAIDTVLSNSLSEDLASRLSYMAFENGYIPPEAIEMARQTGAFMVPAGSKVYFIEKKINDTARQNLLNQLITDFYIFTKTPNLRDEAFSGNSSGISLKFKLTEFNAKVTTYQRKFESASLQMYTALSNVWAVRGLTIDPLNIYLDFTENFPLDLLNEAKAAKELMGVVSDKTRLSQLSFIDDAISEMKQIEEEAQASNFMGDSNIDDTTTTNDTTVDQTTNFTTAG